MSLFTRALLLLVAIGCAFGLAYFIYIHANTNSVYDVPEDTTPAAGFAVATTTAPDVPVNTAPRTAPLGTLEYQNSTYHFSLFYPNNLTVKSYDEGQGAATITFQNVSTAQGFQIFIVPYSSKQVTATRFRQDEPSGVMKDPLNVTVGGVLATSFYSSNDLLGETAEIWFIRDGYLYEVTAPKSLAAWLSQIIISWQYI